MEETYTYQSEKLFEYFGLPSEDNCLPLLRSPTLGSGPSFSTDNFNSNSVSKNARIAMGLGSSNKDEEKRDKDARNAEEEQCMRATLVTMQNQTMLTAYNTEKDRLMVLFS
jgi:hypothetical protein